jgi:hypothetical protein
VGGNDPGAAALEMQTIMAPTAQLLRKKAAVVVQVGVLFFFVIFVGMACVYMCRFWLLWLCCLLCLGL